MFRSRLSLLAIGLLLVAGCAGSPHYLTGRFDPALRGDVALAGVYVEAGLPKAAAGFSDILSAGLERAALLSPTPNARWILRARVTRLDELMLGSDVDATARVAYKLTDRHHCVVVLEKVITSRYQASPSDTAFVLAGKRLAYEGAPDNNVSRLFDLLAQYRPWE